METSIIIDVGISYTRAAICQDGELVNLLLENNYERQTQGTIYQGRVSNVVKGMKAAFIEIGQAKKAFLHYKDTPEELKGKLQNNQRIMVQVVKEGLGDKGPKVTGFINLTGQYIVLLPFEKTIGISRRITDEKERKRLKAIVKKHNPKKYGLILRTGAAKETSQTLAQELEELTRRWEEIETRGTGAAAETVLYQEPSLPEKVAREFANKQLKEIVINHEEEGKLLKTLSDQVRIVDHRTNLYGAYNLEKEIDQALQKRIWLKSGANIVIEATEAMNVIDVNSAKLTKIKKQDKAILKVNLQAAKESARQIRLRNLSGIIIIDLIDMASDDHKKMVVDQLEKELSKDKVKSRVFPINELGLVQITRQRKQLSLKEQLMETCPSCRSDYMSPSYDYLLVKIEKEIRDIARESLHEKIGLKANRPFIKHIENRGNIRTQIKAKYGVDLSLIEDRQMNQTEYDINVDIFNKT